MSQQESLSPWWRQAVILVLIFGFTILIGMAVAAYRDAPPIPVKAVGPSGETIFTREDVKSGQQIFLKYGLMENGTIWGHGAYLGPDFSADYLHTLAIHAAENAARKLYGQELASLNRIERGAVDADVRQTLKQNRYDGATETLTLSASEVESFRRQQVKWAEYFFKPTASAGLPAKYITDTDELRHLTAFFAWTAWASSAERPGKKFSYTNNFPYDPMAGNEPSSDAILWSALSLIALLGGTALVLFAFGKFNYLGWKGEGNRGRLRLMPGAVTESQKSTIKYFVVVSLLFLAQTLVGAATAHYRADPAGFFGIDISTLFPSNIMRTWHLQLAIFWIATAYVAGGLFLAPMLGGKDPSGQSAGVNVLFVAIVIVAVGSLLGEILGIDNLLGKLWFWVGHQGWEYLDLGRVWQMLLALGLVLWLVLLFRAIAPARKDPDRREISSLFLYAAVAIPIFYLPAMFFGSRTHFTVVDMWRFWIIHLWVEGFFELFVTVMVAVIFFRLGIVSRITACRVVYLDAILYLGSGIVGTGHHWYWTGQSNITMALAAVFSALEVVPLTLLTLDAWDFIKVTYAHGDEFGQAIVDAAQMDVLLPDVRWLLEFPRRGRVRVPDQHARRELFRSRHNSHPEPRSRSHDGRVRNARGGADGFRVTTDAGVRSVDAGRKICPCFILGTQHGSSADGGGQPVPRRRTPAPRCFTEWLLARAQSGISYTTVHEADRMAPHTGRSRVHLPRRSSAGCGWSNDVRYDEERENS